MVLENSARGGQNFQGILVVLSDQLHQSYISASVQEISNKTHYINGTRKKPEYLNRSSNLLRGPLVRSHSILDGICRSTTHTVSYHYMGITNKSVWTVCFLQAPSNIIPSGTSSSVSTTQKNTMIDTVLRRSHIGQLDATFGRFVEGCCLCLLIQYRVSQNISRLRNTLAHWCIVCCFLTFLAWNGMSSLHTSLLRVPYLLKWIEHSHYSKCPVNFPAVFTASTSNLQESNWQFSTHPMEMQRSHPSTNWEFPTERKPRTGGLGGLNRWFGDVRGGLVTYSVYSVYSADFQHEPNHNQMWFLDVLSEYQLIYVSFKYANKHPICLTLIHQRHGGWKSKGKTLLCCLSLGLDKLLDNMGWFKDIKRLEHMRIYGVHSPCYQSSPDLLKLSNKPTEFSPGNIARITARAISPGVPAPTKTNKVARLAPCSMIFRSWWSHISRTGFLQKNVGDNNKDNNFHYS